jgi:hypothetical protein
MFSRSATRRSYESDPVVSVAEFSDLARKVREVTHAIELALEVRDRHRMVAPIFRALAKSVETGALNPAPIKTASVDVTPNREVNEAPTP